MGDMLEKYSNKFIKLIELIVLSHRHPLLSITNTLLMYNEREVYKY